MNMGVNPLALVVSFACIVLAITARLWVPGEGAAFVWVIGVLALVGILAPFAMRMAQQWEKAIVLRLGKLHSIRGPGMFAIIPIVDDIVAWIDQRIQTTEFNAEQALTLDAVPATVDAILFWQVHDAQRAALEITDYRQAILRVAQTTLREMIGASPLSALLADRKQADAQLREDIGRKTAEWGISVISVEIRDVTIPAGLQDAMSREAQAERERAARVILGAAERDIAENFLKAAEIYATNPAALQLRAMNIIYETTKERGATVLIPTAMVDSLNAGGIMGLAGMLKEKIT
jgi:regulator of protease activity HflC (stomatin/prohibitin superfamily)